MWLLFACGSAIFAGVTAILAKIGMQHINSTVATALRTGVVLLFSWLLVLLTGAISGIGAISGKTFLFLILSGCAGKHPHSRFRRRARCAAAKEGEKNCCFQFARRA